MRILILPVLLCSLAFAFKKNGMTYTDGKYCPQVGFSDASSVKSMDHMHWLGVNYVAIVVTWYSENEGSTKIEPYFSDYPVSSDGYYTFRTATDDELTFAINYLHQLGIKVMLKPHIDLTKVDRKVVWRGNIGEKFKPEQWKEWFKSYEDFILKYAKMATDLNVESFSVSCELIAASKQTADWRALIPKIRAVYKGELTDSANWGGEEVDKEWWDMVDVIGVDAYYQTVRKETNYKKVLDAWKPIKETLQKIHDKFKKPVQFTEVGYCPNKENGGCDYWSVLTAQN